MFPILLTTRKHRLFIWMISLTLVRQALQYSSVLCIIHLLIYSPVSLAIKRYLGLAGANPFPVSAVFSYFSGFQNFFRAFCLRFHLLIRKALFWTLINTPAIIVFVLLCLLKFFVASQELFMIQMAFSTFYLPV